MKIISFFVLFSFSFFAQAQDKWSHLILKLDSLEQSNDEYAKTVVEIAWQISDLNPDSAIYYANKGLELAEASKNDSIKARALIGMSTAYSMQGKHTESINFCLEALRKSEQIRDTVSIIDAANNIGIDFYYQEDFENALEYFKKCAEISSGFSKGDEKKTIQYAHSVMNVALVEAELGNVENEISSYKQVIDIFRSINYARGYSNALFNLGKTYHIQKQYDKALECYQESAAAFEKNDFNSAYSDVLTQWARLLFEIGKNKEALTKFYKSLHHAKLTNNTLQIQYAYKLAHEIYAEIGQYDSAYFYQTNFQSLLNESREKEKLEYAEEMVTKYETEKKEQQIAVLEQKNLIQELEAERQKQFKLFSIIAVILLILASILFYNRYRIKKKTSELLDIKNQELAKLNNTKNRLFSIISHDLKSPLSSFHTITKSLSDNWEMLEKDQLKEFIITLRDSSSDVKNMMDNLLKWALAQTGELKYSPKDVSSATVIERVKAQLESVTSLKQIRIVTEMNEGEMIKADQQFLEIVIRNLLSNAVKFSAVDSEIKVLVSDQDGAQIISIQDHGVGMDQGQIDQLLAGNIVAQDIQNSSEKGTGLGLNLCKELLNKMGAEMNVVSEKGKGTTFNLLFPKAA